MATGHIRKRTGTNGAISYQLTAEGDRDPLTGKRERKYKTVKGTKKQAEAELRKMISEQILNPPVIFKPPLRKCNRGFVVFRN